jgi:hypothetical protein
MPTVAGENSITCNMMNSKESLLKRLASILNVGEEDKDYVTDVLDQLIEIGEDVGDVASYLTSFLGGDEADYDDNLMQFANDVRRLKLGEEIIIDDTVDSSAESDAARKQPPEKEKTQQLQQRKGEEQRREHQRKLKNIVVGAAEKLQPSAEIKGNPKQANQKILSSTKGDDRKDKQVSKSNTTATKKQQQSLQPTELKKGKAKTICGCYGNKHKPLTNCLHCGRISCEIEGYDFCPFCQILIEDYSKRIQGGDSSFSSALLHKQRLLEFDRTAAARTHILDDQEDYFVSSNSMWSTRQEQENARDMEEERRKLLHERQRQKLSINF